MGAGDNPDSREFASDRSELHRTVFAGLDQPIVEKAVATFFALAPTDRVDFVARVNAVLDGRGRLDWNEGVAP
jgi:hypothetical protein